MAAIKEFCKDPDSVLDYHMDWSTWLEAGDTISSSSWTVDPGLTLDSDSTASTKSTAWLSGGTHGRSYAATNKIITGAGRTVERSIVLIIRNR
jgi:hypothetical protein